jgi:periplasmic divalent cation tolerance protein
MKPAVTGAPGPVRRAKARGRAVGRTETSAAREAAAVRVVLTTVPDAQTASRLAHALVAERLAACVNVVPGITSVYRWEGSVHEDSELLLVVKTQRTRLADLAERLRVLHPYALPELVVLTPSGGSVDYFRWVRGETEKQ